MQTKTKYEEQILKELQGMPVSFQRKMARIVRFFKKEIEDTSFSEKSATGKLLKLSGTWKDIRSVDEQITDIYRSRKSRNTFDNLS